MPKEEFKGAMSSLREGIAPLVAQAGEIKKQLTAPSAQAPEEGQDRGEMIANVVLALRHLEDAAMRFGKAIQASEGGVSPLGGPKTPGQ